MSSTAIQGTVTPEAAPKVEKLTGKDRCDANCIAQAYVQVRMPSTLTLNFCKHDFEKHEPKLIGDGAVIVIDDRAELLPKPYDPATDNS